MKKEIQSNKTFSTSISSMKRRMDMAKIAAIMVAIGLCLTSSVSYAVVTENLALAPASPQAAGEAATRLTKDQQEHQQKQIESIATALGVDSPVIVDMWVANLGTKGQQWAEFVRAVQRNYGTTITEAIKAEADRIQQPLEGKFVDEAGEFLPGVFRTTKIGDEWSVTVAQGEQTKELLRAGKAGELNAAQRAQVETVLGEMIAQKPSLKTDQERTIVDALVAAVRDVIAKNSVDVIPENEHQIRGLNAVQRNADGTVDISVAVSQGRIDTGTFAATIIHEVAEALFADGEQIEFAGTMLNTHTALRGVGKDADNAAVQLEGQTYADAAAYLSALNDVMVNTSGRVLTTNEEDLIRANWDLGYQGMDATDGLQAKTLGREANREHTRVGAELTRQAQVETKNLIANPEATLSEKEAAALLGKDSVTAREIQTVTDAVRAQQQTKYLYPAVQRAVTSSKVGRSGLEAAKGLLSRVTSDEGLLETAFVADPAKFADARQSLFLEQAAVAARDGQGRFIPNAVFVERAGELAENRMSLLDVNGKPKFTHTIVARSNADANDLRALFNGMPGSEFFQVVTDARTVGIERGQPAIVIQIKGTVDIAGVLRGTGANVTLGEIESVDNLSALGMLTAEGLKARALFMAAISGNATLISRLAGVNAADLFAIEKLDSDQRIIINSLAEQGNVRYQSFLRALLKA